jgi:hypothetical protein
MTMTKFGEVEASIEGNLSVRGGTGGLYTMDSMMRN